jgi:hypothetical protein
VSYYEKYKQEEKERYAQQFNTKMEFDFTRKPLEFDEKNP